MAFTDGQMVVYMMEHMQKVKDRGMGLWLMGMERSIKGNGMMGKSMDMEKYNQVVKSLQVSGKMGSWSKSYKIDIYLLFII